MARREITEKDKIYRYVWQCAYKRAYMSKSTPKGERDWTTVQMCLKIAKWYKWAGE